jgi:hypothetical protein
MTVDVNELIKTNSCVMVKPNTKIRNPKGRFWVAQRYIVMAVTDLRARSGEFETPWNAATDPLFKLPPLIHINDRLSDIVDQRAIELNQTAKDQNKHIMIMWSGGIDSTLVVSSFIKNLSAADLQNVTIVLTLNSIMENYNFYQTQIAGRVNCVSWLTVNFTNEFLEKNIVLHGDPGDCLFGPSISMYKDLMPDCKHLESYKNHLTTIAKTIEERNKEAVLKFNVTGIGKWYADRITRNLEESAPADITNVAEWWWWHYINFKWQYSIMRPIFRRKTDGSELSPTTRENIESYCQNSFFNTDRFQQWSYSNLPYHVGNDQKNHKKQAKDYIYELDNDDVYRTHKIKIESVPVYDDSAYFITKRPLLWSADWTGYHTEHPGLTDACVLHLEKFRG